jgi:cell wall-associated NlpC family hydrolase
MRVLVTFVVCILMLPATGQTTEWQQKADSIEMHAKSQLGVPYKWGTSNPDVSFDCSGFTSYVYGEMNLTCSRSSSAYSKLGEKIDLKDCRKGDCIVFAGTARGSRTPGHVGIVLSNTEEGIKFIHCSSSKNHYGVVITDYYESGYPKRFLEIRRLY